MELLHFSCIACLVSCLTSSGPTCRDSPSFSSLTNEKVFGVKHIGNLSHPHPKKKRTYLFILEMTCNLESRALEVKTAQRHRTKENSIMNLKKVPWR
jgi:hypothetical protein